MKVMYAPLGLRVRGHENARGCGDGGGGVDHAIVLCSSSFGFEKQYQRRPLASLPHLHGELWSLLQPLEHRHAVGA